MRDLKEHADTEGEVQMGTTRADGNSVTMLRLLRDGVLSIVDEDRELAMRKVYRETHKRKLGNMTDEMSWVVLTRSRPMRPVEAILG